MDNPLWCEDECGFWGADAEGSTDWEAYDCYRTCLGMPLVERPWWMRAARRAGHRIAATVQRRGDADGIALAVGYLALVLAVVLVLIVLGVVLNLIAGL